ncbi:hypothetical protein K8I61_18840 [bacterium]|nr:hypothetical protein [bacterium]
MRTQSFWALLLPIFLFTAFPGCSCGDDDDDDDETGDDDIDDDADDDTSDDDADDDTGDDDTSDDDNSDDDADDDTGDDDTGDDDTTVADDFVADWPQSNQETRDYDESGGAGAFRLKAQDYDEWVDTWHLPFYGGHVHAWFTDNTYTEIDIWHGFGDSTSWTATYLGTQCMRYWVTGSAEAKQSAIDRVQTLTNHLHVTGKPGFLARFRAPQSEMTRFVSEAHCDSDPDCHRVDTGDYAGDWWVGNTSRDMYVGWFYGMAMAHDLLDDAASRQIIVDDVTEVLDMFISDTNWWIIDVDGLPTTKGPNVLPFMKLAWTLIGYHVTGLDRFKAELQTLVLDSNRDVIATSAITFFNRYNSYYGNQLAHQTWYNILRLGKAYLSEDDYAFLLNTFETKVHTFARLSHNPWFNGIFMSQGDYTPAKGPDPYQAQLEQDFGDFRDPPLWEYVVDPRDPQDYTLDPVSVFLSDLIDQYPWIENLIGDFEYQANEPTTVDQYCPAGFMFQWSPFLISGCGANIPEKVHSGHDYLAAYWLASYHKFIDKTQ